MGVETGLMQRKRWWHVIGRTLHGAKVVGGVAERERNNMKCGVDACCAIMLCTVDRITDEGSTGHHGHGCRPLTDRW